MLYFLAIVFPPVAVLLTGNCGSFILNVILTCLGWIPGSIHAVLVVMEHKADQRADRLVRETTTRHEP